MCTFPNKHSFHHLIGQNGQSLMSKFFVKEYCEPTTITWKLKRLNAWNRNLHVSYNTSCSPHIELSVVPSVIVTSKPKPGDEVTT